MHAVHCSSSEDQLQQWSVINAVHLRPPVCSQLNYNNISDSTYDNVAHAHQIKEHKSGFGCTLRAAQCGRTSSLYGWPLLNVLVVWELQWLDR